MKKEVVRFNIEEKDNFFILNFEIIGGVLEVSDLRYISPLFSAKNLTETLQISYIGAKTSVGYGLMKVIQ